MQNNLMSFTKVQFKRLLVPVALTTILAFINGPMALIFAKRDAYRMLNTFMYFSYVNKFFVYAGIFLMPLLYTRMLYDYLFDEKIADFNLSLPVSRATQYISGFIATSIATAIPVVLNLLITMMLYATKAIQLPILQVPDVATHHMLWEILVMIVAVVIITATCSFVAAFVGTRLEHFSYTVAILILPLVVALIVQGSLMLYIYGIEEIKSLENVLYLSPVAAMFNHAFVWENKNGVYQDFLNSTLNESLFRIGLCAAIAAMLFVVGLRVAKRRKGENSGRKGSRNIVSIVVDIILSYGIGLAVALFFSSIMNLEQPNALVILMTAGFSILIYIIDNFITTQSIKNLKRNIPSMVIILLLSVVAFACYITNGFGFERKLPKVEEIDHVSINYYGYANRYDQYSINRMVGEDVKNKIDDPELIAEIRALHLKALKEMPSPSKHTRIEYITKNGKEVDRYFEPSIDDITTVYRNLHNSDSFNESVFNSFYLDSESFESITIESLGYFYKVKELKLDKAKRTKLLDAIRSDILNNINSDSVMDKGAHIAKITYSKEVTDPSRGYTEINSVTELIRSDYTKTIALLKEFGFKFPERDETNISSIEYDYRDQNEEIMFDKSFTTNYIPEEDLTLEMFEDIFSVTYPSDHFISETEHNSLVFLYVNYWDSESSEQFYQHYCIKKSDMDKIISKYNLSSN